MKQGWKLKKLTEVCRFINGRAYSKNELLNQGKYPVLRVGNFFTSNHWYYSDLELDEDKYCVNGDLLYAWSASFGPRIWKGEKVIYHYHIWKVVPNLSQVTKTFLYQLLEWDTEALKIAYGTGATMMHVGKGSIEKRVVPIPPLQEQRRIVSVLDKSFAAIDKAKANAEQNLKNAKELFESYLQSIFENKNADWVEKTLGEVYDVRDGTHDSPKYYSEGFPLITSKNLKKDLLNYENVNYISEQDYININKRSKVDKGDILFAMIGTIGNPVVIQNEPDFAIKNVALFKIPQTQNSYFLKYFLDAKSTIDKMMRDAKGTTQKFVGLGYLRGFNIFLPPLTVQLTIVKKLDALSVETKKLESIYQKKIEDLAELKKSILQKAFNGELDTTKDIAV